MAKKAQKASKPVPKKVQEAYRKRRIGLGGVAERLGVSVPTARRRLVESEVPIYGRGRPSTKPAPKAPRPAAETPGLADVLDPEQ